MTCPRILVLAVVLLTGCTSFAKGGTRLSDYVRPLVGTAGEEGNTFPGPSAPFGMMQLGPDTDTCLTNWNTCSGYAYDDPTILGFSLTHLTGTGCPDLGDFLFVPQVGQPAIVPGRKDHPAEGYQSAFAHADESAAAGYYRVTLLKSGVKAELTAGERAGLLRFTFPASDQASILTDLGHVIGPWRVAESRVRIEDPSTITGFHLINGWAKERYLYFAARYSRPFDDTEIVSAGQPVVYNTYRFRSHREATGTNLQLIAKFKTHAGEVIQVKVAVSAVSTADALQNLDAEIPGWDFDRLRESTRARWDRELGKIQIKGSPEQKETFYTSLYHALLAPNLYEDVNGSYRGFDQNIHAAKGFTEYSVFSLWDTFRAEHPLLALIEAPRDADMINSLLAHFDQSVDHLLPMWELQGNETWSMIGYHAVPVIVDGYFKGVKGFDAQRAYAAIKATALNPDYDSVAAYAKLGWVPCDQEDESLSKTLEYAYDDWCIAQMAKALGKTEDYHAFMKRAASYKNLYDPATGWMRPKDSNGRWRTPFDAHAFGGGNHLNDVTEATSSQYSWFVPQDVPGLIALMGGNEKFTAKLDALFDDKPSPVFTGELSAGDLRGCLGEYWHGNEPSHHVIYLYCIAGQPWKAAQRLHQVVATQYGNQPGSLCGNDDCGQMSAWYLFTCLGFYPVCPASDEYVIGAPQLPQATMHLSNGKKFTMTAKNISDQNIYVQSVRVNGKNWNSPFLPDRELKQEGTIEFVMGPKPGLWGTAAGIPAARQDTTAPTATPASFVIPTTDGKCTITINTTAAPELTTWADQNLAPVLAEWYPKIVALLPSPGFTAPAQFSVTLRPMDGVAYTTGTNVVASSTWLAGELGGQALGSLVHETVHVVQQYGNAPAPGWLVEGIADYIRWFKYEPQNHGADLVWMRTLRHFTPRYNDGYRVTANFLNWVTEQYDPNIVGELNAALRAGRYDGGLWQQKTGKTAPELGAEWKTEMESRLACMNMVSTNANEPLPPVNPPRYQEILRPQFHFTARQWTTNLLNPGPKQEGWLNDLNGLIYYDGEYHLFAQRWWKCWLHAVSRDLVHWTELPPAFWEEQPDTGDQSGTCVVDYHNTSGLSPDPANPPMVAFWSRNDNRTQCLCFSLDHGRTWERYAKNPIMIYPERDPKVFWYASGRHWVMMLYGGSQYHILTSTNLLNWQDEHHPIVDCFECPDFFELPVDGDMNHQKWVLVQGNGQYSLGSFDGTEFKEETARRPCDIGPNFYATQTWANTDTGDGRRIQAAWMRGSDFPNMPFNQQVSFPCELTLRSTPDGLRLFRQPIGEIARLHQGRDSWSNRMLQPGEVLPLESAGELFQLRAEVSIPEGASLTFNLRGIPVRLTSKTVESGTSPAAVQNRIQTVEILLDRASIETFVNQGEISSTRFVLPGANGLSVAAAGGPATIESLTVYRLNSAWPDGIGD